MADSDGSVTIKLSKPIQAHDEMLSELVLRRPTIAELRASGQPYRVGAAGISCDYEACYRLLIAVCGIPAPSVDQLDAGDFDDAAMTLVGFTKPARPSAGTSA